MPLKKLKFKFRRKNFSVFVLDPLFHVFLIYPFHLFPDSMSDVLLYEAKGTKTYCE